MKALRIRSVRWRATVAATLVTALVLGLASLLIVQLVERNLEHNARNALNDALESASHAASGEGGEGAEASEGDSGGEGGEGGDAEQQAITDASIQEVQAGVDAASRALFIIVPIVVVALGGAIWWTVGRALRPVSDISARVAAISGATLDERVPVPGSDDEIAELAALMNEMLDRLQSSSERQRAFVADASHELRSPLSTIVAAAEVAAVSPDPQKLQKLADTVGGEATRMQSLVADLLDLARLDDDRHQFTIVDVDVAALANTVAARVRGTGLEVVVSATGRALARAVPSQIERVLQNLIDNAVAHADRRVEISVEAGPSDVLVVVDDDGPGIPIADRDRVFERFVRLDESRERASGGTGIGLALVKAIVERLNGTVQVVSADVLGGARVEVRLPSTTKG